MVEAAGIEPASGFTPPLDPTTRVDQGPDPDSPAIPVASLVGAVGLEPTTFGSQNRNGEIRNLSKVKNLQRFRGSSSVGGLAQLAQLAPLAGVLYPNLTPVADLPITSRSGGCSTGLVDGGPPGAV